MRANRGYIMYLKYLDWLKQEESVIISEGKRTERMFKLRLLAELASEFQYNYD